MNEPLSKRTIEEVIDVETGEIIKSEDFFKKPEAEIIAYRRRLQEAIAGFELPKFKCAYCNQLLKLSGKGTRRGEVSFFSHLYDSDDCEIKTNSDYTKEEIEIRKYANIRESQRHIDLKNKIADALKGETSQKLKVGNVEIEKRITSNVPYLFWRQPDISAQIEDINIVFELQLSTTFLSAIIDRDIFYRLHNIFIVWIFNFSDNQEYVNLNNLMCKDIYYANKRNAFVFDEKAQQLSKEEGQLVLLCIWFEPYVENGIFNAEKNIRKEVYIRVSDLKFDYETYKPYYIDADAMFLKYEPEFEHSVKNVEELVKKRIQKIENHTADKEIQRNRKQEQIEEIKSKIQKGETELILFQKNSKWGFEVDGVELIEPKHTEISDFGNNNFAKLKYNKKYGFIDKSGNFISQYDYVEAFDILNNKCIVRQEKEWYIFDLEKNIRTHINCYNLRKVANSKNLLEVTYRSTKKVFSGINYGGYKTYTNQYYDTSSIITFDGNNPIKCLCNRVYKVEHNRLISLIDILYVSIDIQGNETRLEEQDANYIKTYFGITDTNGNTIIPFEYDAIEDFFNGKAKARISSKYGYIDEKGNTIIPFEYDAIEDFFNGKAKARISSKYGYIDEKGNTIIPFEYDIIEDFINGKAKARISNKYGYIDEQGKIIIHFKYDAIENFIDGKTKVTISNKYGYIDEQGNTIIPFEYDAIEDFFNGNGKARISNKYGYIDEKGNTIIPFEYDIIEDFTDGKAKARKNSYHGYIDEQGNQLIQNIKLLENGLIKGERFGKWGIETIAKKIQIPFEYDIIEDFIDGKAKARISNKYGYFDEQGNTIIPFQYDAIEDFISGKAKARISSKYGYIDEQGNTIIPFEYDAIKDFIDGKAKARISNKYGYIDEQDNTIIPFEYEAIEDFFNGKAKARISNKYGYIDEQDNTIIPFEYEAIEDFFNGKAKARISNKYGYIDEQGNTIIPFEYEAIEDFFNGKAKARISNKYGYIDEQGNTIIPFEYEAIEDFISGKAKARISNKYGYIDEQGNTIIPFEYDAIKDFIDGKAKVTKNRYHGILDTFGHGFLIFKETYCFTGKYGETIERVTYGIKDLHENLISDAIYDEIEGFNNGLAKVYTNKQYVSGGKFAPIHKYKIGCINGTGTLVIPCIFDKIDNFIDGKAKAKRNGKYMIIDEQGNETIQDKSDEYMLNSTHTGEISDILDYGIFVEFKNGITGLLHISELKRQKISLVDYYVGMEIVVKIQSIDNEKNRISLSFA